jgi:hypothetical protein
MSIKLRIASIGAILLATAAAAAARREPPPEAIEACAQRAEGDACTVELPDRTVDGTCRARPDGEGPLACMPDRPPPGECPEPNERR